MIKENEACKKIISEFLYPNDKVKKFLTRDLNEELNEIIDNNTLINEDNRVDSIRQSNLWENVKSVGNFLQKNSDYYETITKIWGSNDIIDNIRLILVNQLEIWAVDDTIYFVNIKNWRIIWIYLINVTTNLCKWLKD